MNIQEIISSGLIEQYVLGLTTPAEAERIERLVREDARVRVAVAEAEASLEEYARLQSVQPDESVRSRVMTDLQRLRDQRGLQADSMQREAVAKPTRRVVKISGVIATAACVLFLVSLSLNGIYINKYRGLRDRYRNLLASQEQALAKNESMRARLETLESGLQILQNPDVQSVRLTGVAAREDAFAVVYWNTKTGSTYFGATNLTPPPPGKSYQLWAIVAGKPIDMGVYEPGRHVPLVQMKDAPGLQIATFAITLEKEGGSPTPTLDQMVAAGNT